MTDSARRALVEWCRAQQIAAHKYIVEGGKNVEGAQMCIRDCIVEELLIEGERDDQAREREDIQE